ncbi:helix-turn-helix domain-containing protein [Desulfovibrio sp.]|mgnify:FL=1|uniref:excisionase family DNA-binding protein n=1 Tax=Desulfovibrio sp. TaxID=885 RepID=UPI0025BC44C8|nr:helix-turn-helix domain-containing protein [Desulfovibrio sp.]
MVEKINWPHIGMTVEECAEALRIDRKTIFLALQDGLPARKVGRSWRIDPDAVKAWLATGNAAQALDNGEE